MGVKEKEKEFKALYRQYYAPFCLSVRPSLRG